MAIPNANDISVVLSGGTTNINPNNSLGGDPSSSPIVNNILNNLFDDVSPKETDDGHEDYRCIYFFNDGDTPVFLVNLWVASEVTGGSTIEVGIEQVDEIQRITLDNAAVTGGSYTLSFDGVNFTSTFNADLGIWATTLQNTLNALLKDGDKRLSGVVVNAQPVSPTHLIFDVTFKGSDGSNNQPKFVLVSDNLVPATVDIFISTPQEGSPVNTIAPEISLETTPPGGVGFFSPTKVSPIAIPRMDPEDGFPLWVKRTTVAGIDPKENDGVTLRFAAETLEPST